MPHKHKRRQANDESQFNLPPSVTAKSLPAFHHDAKQLDRKRKSRASAPDSVKRAKTSSKSYAGDDTPRAFARLLQFQEGKRLRSGLDDGAPKAKGKKKQPQKQGNEPSAAKTESVSESAKAKNDLASEVPKILPGERLADYSARVNRALPVSGLARKGKLNVEGPKERQTKTEKRLHRMYAEWREEDAKRKAAEEEFAEQQEEEDEERAAALGVVSLEVPNEGKRTRRKRMLTETADVEDDPWAVLKEKRGKVSRGLHDVVQEPPTLKPVREKFKVNKGGAAVDVMNVPKNAGSLKKREELSSARMEIIERYRAMMKGGG